MARTSLTIALAALLLGSMPARADVLLGAAGPFSGANAALGEQLRRGVEVAVSDLNATGGLRGERLAVTFGDDGCDPRKAVEVATGFVSEGVKAVIGHYCSGASIPASQVYAKAGIVQISPASSHPKLTDEGPWNVLRLVPRDDDQAAAAARLVIEKFPGRKIAIVNDQAPGPAGLASRFRAVLVEKGIAPAAEESFKAGSKEFGALAERLAAAGVEVVYFAGSYVEGGLLARALRAAGSSAQIVAGDSLVSEDFANTAKEAAEGTLVTFTFDPRKLQSARSLVERLRAEEQSAEGFTLYAYAAVQVWVAAAEATGGTDSTRIAQWLRAGNRVNTVVGPVQFDAKGDLMSPRIAWFRWDGGRYIEIDPATLDPPVLDTTP
ncbi:branched-chain amino acid ABC transporter substrate-binding protein [Aestuariivirga sp.]|uniref:branched-chain amino acid ABC transporter substrate-binding protein n=1 Tax=Aestuariivirga sp. TaxID=2650926 RepID=UPI003919585E